MNEEIAEATEEPGFENVPDGESPASDEGQAAEEPTEPTLDDLAKEALGETDPGPDEELVEIEHEGVTLKVPPKLKDAFLRHQDYTKKTMSLADERKAHEQARETFQQSASQIAANFQGFVELSQTQAAIQQLAALDTSKLTREQVSAAQQRLAGLQQRYTQLNTALQQNAQQMTQAESQEMAKLREQALSEAAAKIPNFSDKRQQELEAFAMQAGVPKENVDTLTDAWAYELLHFADIGKKFIERQSKAATMKAANAGKPARTVGGKSSGGKSPQDMAMDEVAAMIDGWDI